MKNKYINFDSIFQETVPGLVLKIPVAALLVCILIFLSVLIGNRKLGLAQNPCRISVVMTHAYKAMCVLLRGPPPLPVFLRNG